MGFCLNLQAHPPAPDVFPPKAFPGRVVQANGAPILAVRAELTSEVRPLGGSDPIQTGHIMGAVKIATAAVVDRVVTHWYVTSLLTHNSPLSILIPGDGWPWRVGPAETSVLHPGLAAGRSR